MDVNYGKIETLLRSGQAVFTIDDLCLFWRETNADTLKSLAKYYVDRKKLHRLRRGIYALNPEAEPFSIAQKLVIPSYISLDSALTHHGIIYQSPPNITCVAPYSKTIQVADHTYVYHKLHRDILTHPLGILRTPHYTMACAERAVADWIYLRGLAHFDNFGKIDKNLLLRIAEIYDTKQVMKNLRRLAA